MKKVEYVVYTNGTRSTTEEELSAQRIPYKLQKSQMSCLENNIAAWQMSSAPFTCVLPDDLILTNNFDKKVKNLVTNEDVCYSLFHYFVYPHENPVIFPCGMGIILSNKHRIKMLEFAKRYRGKHDDEMIGLYCYYNHIPVIVAWPNLTEHVGDISRANPGAGLRKSVWFEA